MRNVELSNHSTYREGNIIKCVKCVVVLVFSVTNLIISDHAARLLYMKLKMNLQQAPETNQHQPHHHFSWWLLSCQNIPELWTNEPFP